ncbi:MULTISPECIES: 2-oxoglutarate dehydrogenase, E2 component, dihydrolipoamide succinyltransferase [unclassified Corynebacterium]|uniref:2-oxoglutarate dehydrogenase, E2 component, dihydrolipoamide succinyltransferase n=1 Tax=unclassified Corynebacterium TaxID=2624378 RepID=UPI00264A8DE4|nr:MULTISPECIES: 2-oxoglutarate dehydrogenase, E2 component, dihydrolipoamide succinyltransferase [unclassified Corynebacterium]MDN8593572.1 2-oxoglutarate dehydrogenase, E2 component, dihydrolipoamide succinyltransferase [Corynebacterium sp. P4_F2]WKK55700.1 2-oxoglutarate dehydrogenase, E2 component, dihydrolipoamide succinyltransferase [Corynebacterium sp. P4-C1]WKK63108.1 2-oxoglutarate dehydrogenase, E2 component, dihydrolipoamide succinyltransferase [Corynebacterium sp. P8-C1]
MAHSVEMPELGESVTEGTITTWLKSVGDTVEVDEPLLEVSTDKVDTEIPSPVAGVLLEIKAEEDDTVEVGEVIAVVGEEGEKPSGDSADKAEAKEEKAESESKSESKPTKKSGGSSSATDVEMPELGESVTEGTITTWLKEVGDEVEVDEPLLEVSTDKVDTEIPSPVAGTLVEILAQEDDTVEVGEVIARVGDADAVAADSDDSADETEEAAAPAEAPKKSAPKSSSDKKGSGESTEVAMPELGESVTEGTITTWLKEVGDLVEVDEPLLEVSTDKVDTEIPSPVAGTLLEILVGEDDTIEVGAAIARIGDAEAAAAGSADEADSEAEPEAAEKPAPKQEEKKAEPKQAAAPASSTNTSAKIDNGGKVPYVTPLVRKLADKHHVDLNTVEGTGVGGRIRKQDVLAAAEGGSAKGATESKSAGTASAAPEKKASGPRARWSTKAVDPAKQELIGTTQKVNRIREITASKMVESLQTSAQLTHVQEVDVTRIADLRKKVKPAFVEKHGANITFLAFFVKAASEALVSHPNVNASYNKETKEITYHEDVNIGIAVDTPTGLLVPVLKQTQNMSLAEIAQGIADLASRARDKKLRPDDLSGATFTVTNIGSAGALMDTPILTPPQSGILGTGAIVKRPVIVTEDGIDSIAIRSMCYLPFTYDHQIVDGADAGRFITTIKDRVETGDFEEDMDL